MKNSQKECLWLGAFRYYLGRMTIAVSEFTELLIQEWPNLPEKTKYLIKSELEDAFKDDDLDRLQNNDYKRLGHDCDRREWQKVRNLK